MSPSTESTDLELTDSAFKPLIVESIFSDDGQSFYIYKLALDGGQQLSRVVCEKWELMCNAPELAEHTTRLLSTDGWEIEGRDIEVSRRPRLDLVPSKWTIAPQNLYNFIHSVQLTDQLPLETDPRANAQDDWGRLLTEHWGSASHRDNFLILCRRKRVHHPPSDDNTVSQRRSREAEMLARQMRWCRPRTTYNEELDFDEIPESEGSSQAGGSSLLSDPELSGDEKPNSNSRSLERLSSISDHVSEMEDVRSLSEIGSTESGSSNDWNTSLSVRSNASSSSSSMSTMSAERLRIYEFLNSSDNPWHYHEITLQHPAKGCDQCGQDIWRWLHCFECSDSDFDVCLGCVDKGRWCMDRSHELLEADGDGPITMRRFPQWAITNEIRVYDLHDDGTQNCVFENSAAGEDLLHESQPAIHPSAPILAWPLSPTKLLLASFDGDKERIIQGMKPFVKHGRKIDVQVRFSDSGSHLLVASTEAVKVRDPKEEAMYSLHMQVAVLQLRFDGQTLKHPVALCERHHNLRTLVPSTLETLPFSWTWTANEVCLTLRGDRIRLWRARFYPSGQGRVHPCLGLLQTSAAQLPLQYQNQPFKAQLIHAGQDNVPIVALAPFHVRTQSESPSVCNIKADSPWSACDEEDDTSYMDAQRSSATLVTGPQGYEAHRMAQSKSPDEPFSTMPTQLDHIRSEIRLLCLLPGSTVDALRCTLAKVSLDDLETCKSKVEDVLSEMKRTAEEKNRKSHAAALKKKEDSELYSADFEPRVYAHVDYSKTQDADVTVLDMMHKAALESNTLIDNLSSLSLSNVPENLAALVSAIMEERNQDRATTLNNWLHPKYNYEALSYVWGQSSGNRTITVDGKEGVPVTDNLHAALRRLRRPDRQRILWVDSLCINQENIKERSWQVQMMGRIYSTAARVVIWLGDAEDLDPNLDQVPTEGGDELSPERDEDVDEDNSSSSGSTKSEKVSKWQRDTLVHVLKTASPPWWTRAWVTQELVLANDISVAFGAAEVGWLTFKSAMYGIWDSIGELRQLIELRRGRRTWQYKGSIGETALLARHTKATDARDKVYSLLSLVKKTQKSRIEPNYALKPMEVFIQATYADMADNVDEDEIYEEAPAGFSEQGTPLRDVPSYPVMSDSDQLVQTGRRPDRFRILNWAKPDAPNRSELPGMPSWALDFSDPDVLTGDAEFRFGSERWTFDGDNNLNQRALLKLSEDNRRLTVRGAILGRVKDIVKDYPVREYRNRPAEDMITRLLVLLSGLPLESPYKLVSGSNAKLRTDDIRAVRRANFIVKETKPGALVVEFKERVAKILLHWDPIAEHGTIDWTDLHSLVLNRGDCDVEGCRCAPSQFFRSWDSCVGVHDDARNFSWPDKTMKQTSPWEQYCELLKGNEQNHVRPRDPLRDEECRFLMTTSSGFIGLGPETADTGDVISLFYGSDIPVVLRPEGDHYLYRGRAWINGIMQGELWNIYEDPLLEEQDFVIL